MTPRPIDNSSPPTPLPTPQTEAWKESDGATLLRLLAPSGLAGEDARKSAMRVRDRTALRPLLRPLLLR